MLFLVILFYLVQSQQQWPKIKVGTWNTMQQPWLTDWSSLVINNTVQSDLDVIHLSEIWTAERRNQILNHPAVKEAYPFYHFAGDKQGHCGCNFTDNTLLLDKIGQFLGCAQSYQIDTRQLIQPRSMPLPFYCQLAGINIAFHNFDFRNFLCLSCVINTAQQSTNASNLLQEISDKCGSGTGDKYSYKGVNGQLILSKFQIREVEEISFNGWLANRINIHATIRGVKFAFGHFAYNIIEDFDPSAAIYMYGETQVDQAKGMISRWPDVIVGDLNTGPDYQPGGYNAIINAGYKSVFGVNQPKTYCAPSSAQFPMCLNFDGSQIPSQSIDHIFIRDVNTLASSDEDTFNVSPLMSDHIGVKALIAKKPPTSS